MTELIISLDVGTTVAKAVMFEINGKEVDCAEQAFTFDTPRPNWVEQDPAEIWDASLQVLKQVIGQNRSNGHILAISLATQGGSLIALGRNNEPVYPCITWMDQRSADLVNRLRQEGKEQQIRRICGWSLEPGLPLPSILWLRENQSEVFNSVEKWLSINDFLGYRLTGVFATNPSMAGEMLLTEIQNGKWSSEICNYCGINDNQLSEILPSIAIIGKITKDVSDLIGLGEEIPVINGGQDHSCEALAAGMTAYGQAFLACGTAWVINGVLDQPKFESVPSSMNLNFHVIPGLWTVSQFLGGLGGCMEWFFKQCWQGGILSKSDIERNQMITSFNAALEKTIPGANGLICIPLSGNRQFPSNIAHGAYIGLRIDHTLADMGRALMEGAAFELRWALETLLQTGMPVRNILMVGGATRSPHWPKIVTDASGVEISTINFSHGPALGAAMLACVGLGIHKSLAQSQDVFKVTSRRISPDQYRKGTYDLIYQRYQEINQSMNTPNEHGISI